MSTFWKFWISFKIWDFFEKTNFWWLEWQHFWGCMLSSVSSLFVARTVSYFTHVVYFDQPSGAARTRKLVETYFSAIFQPFLFILELFLWFHSWNQQKTSENEWKKRGFVYSSKLVDMQKLVDSLRGYLEFVFFRLNFKQDNKKRKNENLGKII